MESKYYIPDISEFVQGFTFEKLTIRKGDRLGSIIRLGEDKPIKEVFANSDEWEEITVWWKREPRTITTEYEGLICTSKEFPEYDWHPWIDESYIINLLKDGKIRAIRK